MAHYVNGTRMATADAEIKTMLKMAKEIFEQPERERIMHALNQKEEEFTAIILEGRYSDKAINTAAGGEKCFFSITSILENEERTAFQLNGSVLLPEKCEAAAFHMMAFTYNADGPLNPVGLCDTVFVEEPQEAVENTCMVRKVLLDAWHLGIMMTLAIIKEENVEVISKIVVLNEEQNDFFERKKKDSMNKRDLICKCAEMFEKYYDRLSGKNDRHTVYSLDAEDKKIWKEAYYAELQKYADIQDADFFQPADKGQNPDYGVGKDGEFVLYEYCNIRYQLYRCMVQEQMKMMGVESLPEGQIADIGELLKILESYVPQFMHKGTQDTQAVRFRDEHKKMWDRFYELNRNEELIPDGSFFGNIHSNPNYGIGKDGAFYGVELLHFLGNCYKIIFRLLSGGNN